VGAQYATRQELRAAQSAVWGDTTRASRVQVRVEVLKADTPAACARFERDNEDNSRYRSMPTWNAPFTNTALPYALFPFQGQLANGRSQIEIEPACCIHKATFRLTVISHKDIDFAKQVEPALWAWVNFGGLGSRTRRGCGAIVCKALAPKDVNDLKASWVEHMPELFPQREWPTLADSLMLRTKEQPGDPIPVWSYVVGKFRHFRQGNNFGRNPGQQSNRPGRSRYSEPETIRRVTGQRLDRHARLTQIPDDAFPRAELGLPIVFHFQEQGDPPDTVLYPDHDSEEKKRERMASPLILKPLALQSGKAVPLILRLKTPALTGVDLRIKKKDLPSLHRNLQDRVRRTMQPNDSEGSLPLPDPTRLVDPSLSNYSNSPLAGSQNGSAIEAFLAFARAEGFTEVTR
jgi:CRISPR-associated protein Cmr1